ncbi:DNA repair protein RecN [Virgibacillus sp. YIM 98842]|uniref:DNA repair protein RecN n=1 Tax=Virgibacillus sp. YIM 98842 TaxID=2663533 RepID=UPI0013DD3633|nr:DNA repair protein RecN [Virgibacillus sp. YIM 98842]
MLTELSIKNFAIIDKISITFNDGLTVLTGETGAGKSIIIDAVQLLAGGRGSVEFVRHGSEKAEIQGLFTIENDQHRVFEIGKTYGIEISDQQVILQRVITAGGKSICRINGKLVTLAILREFGRTLIDIHSQHETQSLMNPENHIDLLDLYDPDSIRKEKETYLDLFESLQSLKKRFKKLNENEQENAHRLDLLEFQKQELEDAELIPDEDVELEQKRNKLANFERIYNSIQDAYNALYGEQKGLEWVNKAQTSLLDNSKYDPFIAEKGEEIADHYFALEELSFELGSYMNEQQYDPDQLNEIEARLDELDRLKKKYGSTVNEMIKYAAKIEEEIDQLKNKEYHLANLQEEIIEKEKDAYLEAKQLHDSRKNAAKALTAEMYKEFKDLYLEKASFKIEFNSDTETKGEPKLHQNGFDHVHFLISTNPGEPLKLLHKIASGGELSRIMLALKRIFARHQGITSVIFDEVDTGVSGRVAQAIAEKIYQISAGSQVLCITHLPQVASMADTHKLIEKSVINNRTTTIISQLIPNEQIDELSRMITGTELTETAKEHAREMLDLAEKFKNKLIKKAGN